MKVMLYVWLDCCPGPFARVVELLDDTPKSAAQLGEAALLQLLFSGQSWPSYVVRVSGEVVEDKQ